MAYGVLRCTVHREEARQTTPEAHGLPSPATAWKGMGPCGYHKPPSLTITSCLGYFLVFLGVVFMSGLSRGEGCLVEQCSDEYKVAEQNLEAFFGKAIHDNHHNHALCAVLRTFKHCLSKFSERCVGNIAFYTLRTSVQTGMNTNNCTANGQTVEVTANKTRPPLVPAICMYHGKKVYSHCGLFGDPHLRTFYEEFQTCKVKGAWPLVNNDYLIVQVTNDPVQGNMDATATSKLTVIVKGNAECTSKDFQTYQAQTNSLPGTFDDGKVRVGEYNSLEVVEVDPGRHVEIHIRYINTVIVVRQIGRYFTFSIRMPEELVNTSSSSQDLQLCVRGCPQSELINYGDYLASKKYTPVLQSTASAQTGEDGRPSMSRSQAEDECRNSGLVDFYFDSCVFDLMATGDQNFTLSAWSSFQDVLRQHPLAARSMENRTSLENYDKLYRSNGPPVLWTTCRRGQQVTVLLLLTLVIRVLCSR